jgi:hypothetical protein
MTLVRSHPTRFARALRVTVWGAAALLIGCHGGIIFTPGTPVLTMGDMSGNTDFASYIVAVDSITLTANDGTVVTLLGTPETIDLARLNDMTELVEVPAVNSGTYISASFVLDYTAASISVNVNGHAVPATVVNPSGAAITTDIITVTFDPSHPLVITNGASTRLHIDVDLAASNTISATTTSSATVTAQPFVVLTPAPLDATVMRARGLFVTTQSIASGYYMNTRPFFDQVSALGAVIVNTNAQTYFNINGVTYSGAAGLAALAQLQENTPTAAYGTLGNLSGITPTFNATSVYVGTSQESPLAEYLSGVVSSRSGDTLTLLGATFLSPLGTTTFYDTFSPVTLGSGTIVSEDGADVRGLTSASVSVGQHITVSGQQVVNSSGTITGLDATAGQVRLQSTPLWGTLNSATSSSVSLDVLSLGNFAPAGFSFAGTGATAGQDATPGTYAVSTGALNESALAVGTLLQISGIVTPFGTAPPDFTAATITPGSATLQQLVVEWVNGGATAPFSSASSAGLVVNLTNADLGTIHYIRTGPVTVDLKSLPASPLITTVGAEQSNLQLAVGNTTLSTGISVFNSATTFATGLSSALNGTNKVYRLVADGQYDSNSNTFVASRIHVALEET